MDPVFQSPRQITRGKNKKAKPQLVPKERDNLMMGVTRERGELYLQKRTWQKFQEVVKGYRQDI